jgi:hypothetical protein
MGDSVVSKIHVHMFHFLIEDSLLLRDYICSYEPGYAIPCVVGHAEQKSCHNIVTWLGVAIDYRVYLWSDLLDSSAQSVTTLYSSLLHTHWCPQPYHHLPLLRSGCKRRTFVFGFRNWPHASTTSFSQQQLIDWIPGANPPAYFGTDHTENSFLVFLFTCRCLVTAVV